MSKKKPRKLPVYRSKFEARIAKELKDKKIPFEYEAENIKYTMPESKHNYKPDFKLKTKSFFIETKGKWDSDSRKKMALVKEQHPTIEVKILFMRDQPIRKGSSTYYSDICKKLGYDYAFGSVPDSWLC